MFQLYGHRARSSSKGERTIAISPVTWQRLVNLPGSRVTVIEPGTHTFGPENGALWVRTGRTGAAAQAGHDLLIEVTAWQATLDVGESGAQTSVALEVDATSLRVREGVGGMQALGDDDKASIQDTIDDEILKRMSIEFRSTAVDVAADGGRFGVQGELSMAGNARPLDFDLVVGDDGDLEGSILVKQSDWGITPYSTLFGALKVADEVEVVVKASFGRPGPDDAPVELEWSAPWDVEWRPTAIVRPGVSSLLWSLVFSVYLWLGMAAIGVPFGTSLLLALVASFPIFVFIRTRGVGRASRAADQSL
ncbi:MAG: YceI family protein [Gaiellaceae bacterium]